MNIQENVGSLLSFFLVLHLINKSNAGGPCVYDLDARGIIDLTSVGRVDGIPMWKDTLPQMIDQHLYSYNPCHSFNEKSCTDVAACQTHVTDQIIANSLGTQNSLHWVKVAGQDLPTLTYTAHSDPIVRTLHVNLICLNSGEPNSLQVYGYESITNSYIMTLSSKCACYGGCKDEPGPGPKPGGGITDGAVVIILLLISLIVYLVSFMAFNKFKRQATGIDILPHRTFWVSLPGYSLDGVKFVYQKATGKSGYTNVT